MAGIGRRLKYDLVNPAYLGLVRKVDREIFATAASTARFIESFLSDVERLQVTDQAAKKCVESVKDAYYDLIDAFEELNLQEAKIKSRPLGHPLPFSELRTGLHKARGIIDQIHVLVAKNAKDLGLTPERMIRAEGTALADLVSSLINDFLYSEHDEEDLVRKLGRGMLRDTLAAAFGVMHVIRNAGILQVSDRALEVKWVRSAERILKNAINVLKEVKQEAKKARLLAHQLSFCNPHMGRHKIRGIVNQLVVLAVYAEILVLSSRRIIATPPAASWLDGKTILGRDEEGTTLAALVFRLIDDLLDREHENLVQKMDTSMLRETLHIAVLVIYNAESLHKSDRVVKESVKRAKDVLYSLINLFEEVKKEAKKARLLARPPTFWERHKMNGIFRQVRDLTRDADRLGLDLEPIPEPEENPAVRATLPTTPLTYEAKIYGRDEEKETLITQLLDVAEGIQFISVVGTAGIGKSALARLVYNHHRVARHFDCRAWVFVSGEFSQRDIVKPIINSLTSEPVNEVEEEELEWRFRQTVSGKRCLIVLDDVRNEHTANWLDLKRLFGRWAAASKIFITSRHERVGWSAASNIMKLSGVSEEACWSIIKDSAFGSPLDDESQVEKNFKGVGKEIAKKCKGVPLIAKSLGGALHFKNTTQQWQEVLQSDVWDIEAMTHLRLPLMLSYSMMPPKLRQCLLYCSIFPKNHSIDVGKLIKLWMAHGFVTSDQDEMEREGREYVQQLLDRSIFQEFKQDGNGNFKCKLEGGMRDLIQFLGENECHIMLLDHENEPKETPVPANPRHCTLNIVSQTSFPESIDYAKKLHTLMILSEYSSADPTNLAGLLSHMRRVRALDLSSCSIKELPLKAGELLYLRYLDLSFNHDLKKLPQALCNLLNLQSLILNGCHSLRKLPKGIGKLIKLRHLEILWTTSLSYLPKGIASLTSLRTLSRFFGNSVADSRACNLGDLEKLNYVQGCITIDGLGGETDVSDAAKACLKNKKDLLGLELWFSAVGSESNDIGVLEALEAPQELKGLGIFYYRGESFPNWMTALECLTYLMLSDCSNSSILPPLGKLPYLKSLKMKNMSNVKNVGSEFLGVGLNNADGGEEGSSSTLAFPRLQNLCFQKLDNWEEWAGINDNGRHATRDWKEWAAKIMPSVSSLSIVDCPKLRAVPDYINVKENLSLDIKNCPLLEETQRINKIRRASRLHRGSI